MIAIQTKYLSPTNHKGSRIKAWVSGRPYSVTISYDHKFSHEMVHFQAVKELVKKFNLDWNLDNMRFGGVDNGYVFCFDQSIVEESM